MTIASDEATGLGNYFVANYPPFSFWKPAHLPEPDAALQRGARARTRRWGCTCTFPSAASAASSAISASTPTRTPAMSRPISTPWSRKSSCTAGMPVIGGRPLQFVYFGGGTPSYLSAAQLRGLMERLQAVLPWDGAEEVTFECEPGTLQQHKLEALRELGVTRLSLGIENFDRQILEVQRPGPSRAEIHRAYGWARDLGFDQINIDLIAGMVGETLGQLARVRRARRSPCRRTASPSTRWSCRTTRSFSKELQIIGQDEPAMSHRRLADQAGLGQLRLRHADRGRLRGVERLHAGQGPPPHAVRLPRQLSGTAPTCSAPASPRSATSAAFTCRTSIPGSSTSRCCDRGELPLGRALPVEPRQRLIREMILQLKTGRLRSRLLPAQVRHGHSGGVRATASSNWQHDGYLTRIADGRRADARRDCCRWIACCRCSSSRSIAARRYT